jgi:LPS export ABC transporter protein LptC
VAALAAALAACQGSKQPPVATQGTLADSADQVMFGAKSVLTDRGLLRAELVADTAYFFDNNTRIELRDVHLTFFSATGAKNAVLTSREGTYRPSTGFMEARGNVVVVAEDGRTLRSPQLRFKQAENQIESDSAFTLVEAGGRSVQGIGFRSDPNMNSVRILKQTGGTGGVLNVPQTP